MNRIRIAATLFALLGLVSVAEMPSAQASTSADPRSAPAPLPPGFEPGARAADLGDVALFDNSGRPVTSGDGSTVWLARLPEGATCPGDSANDQWRIQGFFVPVSDDVNAIKYGPAGPTPVMQKQFSLYSLDLSPYVHEFLIANGGEGQPGVVPLPPAMSFTLLAQNRFAGGTYRLGFACTYFGTTTQYWDTVIEMSGAPGATDAELSWSVPNPADVVARTESSRTTVWVLVGVAAALALGVLVLRSRHRTNLPTKES
jgi:hypothetical protein